MPDVALRRFPIIATNDKSFSTSISQNSLSSRNTFSVNSILLEAFVAVSNVKETLTSYVVTRSTDILFSANTLNNLAKKPC